MVRERKFVSDDVRKDAVARIEQKQNTRKEIAAELGVALPTVHLWMAHEKAKKEGASLVASSPSQPIDERYVDGLKMRIKQLELDVKYLKEKLALYEGQA